LLKRCREHPNPTFERRHRHDDSDDAGISTDLPPQ